MRFMTLFDIELRYTCPRSTPTGTADVVMRTRVLFLCKDNAVQSPAAEAILRAVAGDLRFESLSAGVTPAGAFDRRLLASLQAHGIAPPPGAPRRIEAGAGKARRDALGRCAREGGLAAGRGANALVLRARWRR
jgi:Low molecular weight phosphotyrosine protein phosphatase